MTDSIDTAVRVRHLLARELGVELVKVVATARLDDDLVADVVMELEDEFGVMITEDQLEQLGAGTVADVVALIEQGSNPT